MTADPPPGDQARFEERLDEIRGRIDRASSDPASVRIVAVTKGFGLDRIRIALAAGLVDIGENYATELVGKARDLAGGAAGVTAPDPGAPTPSTGPTWHFLGAIQRNKVARLAPVVDWWQTVSRVEEGTAIARRRPGATVLVQVDVAGLPGRGGCRPEQVGDVVAALRDEDLAVVGLMAVGSPGTPEEARPGFTLVSRLADTLSLPVRSMGMSDDLDVALAEGSTMVRLGRSLFGPRPPRP